MIVRKNYILFIIIAMALIAMDQVTKSLVNSYIVLHQSMPVIDGFFNLVHVRNPGAAFGFLARAPEYFRSAFFIAVTIGAVVMILYFFKKNEVKDITLILALSLIFGGALGNLIDRIRFGEVVDFLDVYVSNHHWPAFNVADSAISIGAILLLVSMIKRGRDRKQA